MSYQYNQRSQNNLLTCHQTLQNLFNEVITKVDCSVLCGHRGEAEQNKAFEDGYSKIQFPMSKHNSLPSLAVDVYPYPYDWDAGKYNVEGLIDDMHTFRLDSEAGKWMLVRVLNNLKKFYYFGGIVRGIAWELGIPVRWGGDWDSDNELSDQNFNDLPHWELII